MSRHSANCIRTRSKGWHRVDTRGRLLPGRFLGLLRLLDDSLSIRVLPEARS